MSDIQETMAKKRKAADTMQAILEGQTRTVRILTYTKAQLPTAHCLELGGFDGMLIFNDGQATFNVQQTTFIRDSGPAKGLQLVQRLQLQLDRSDPVRSRMANWRGASVSRTS